MVKPPRGFDPIDGFGQWELAPWVIRLRGLHPLVDQTPWIGPLGFYPTGWVLVGLIL